MIVLDTHIWLWQVNSVLDRLPDSVVQRIESSATIGVSVMSCLEVAWLARKQRITLPVALDEWFTQALAHHRFPGKGLVEALLTRRVGQKA